VLRPPSCRPAVSKGASGCSGFVAWGLALIIRGLESGSELRALGGELASDSLCKLELDMHLACASCGCVWSGFRSAHWHSLGRAVKRHCGYCIASSSARRGDNCRLSLALLHAPCKLQAAAMRHLFPILESAFRCSHACMHIDTTWYRACIARGVSGGDAKTAGLLDDLMQADHSRSCTAGSTHHDTKFG
jgi:hypothetical protein